MLEQVALFSELGAEQLAAVERVAARKRYRANTVIIEHGDEANSLYLVLSGRVRVSRYGADDKVVVLRDLGPGAYVGELALLVDGRRSATVETLEDAEFLVLTRQSFEKIIAQHPQIMRTLLRDVAARLCELTEDFGNLALLDVYGRIVKLLEHAAIEEDGRRITEQLTHQDIARRVGASREMVSKILKDLRVGGYIEVVKRRVVLNRPLPERW